MNWAPRAPHPQLVNEKRADGDHEHDRDPDAAERPVRQRAFGCRKLHEAEHERRHRRECVKLDRRRSGQERRESHALVSYFARNAAILSFAWAIANTPFRWPLGPTSLAVSTGVPFAAIAFTVSSTSASGKTRSVGVLMISAGTLILDGSAEASWFAFAR